MAVAIELPLLDSRWTLTVSAVGRGDEAELLRSSGRASTGAEFGIPLALLGDSVRFRITNSTKHTRICWVVGSNPRF